MLDNDAETPEAQTSVSVPSETNGDAATADLDALLAEFDASTRTTTQPALATESSTDMSVVLQRLHKLEVKEADSEVNALVTKLKASDELKGASDRLIRNYIEGEALRNPKLASAYANRHNDPKAWKSIEKGLAKAIADDLPKYDAVASKVQSDRTAMIEATKTASLSETKPAALNFATMSHSEFREYERKMGITV